MTTTMTAIQNLRTWHTAEYHLVIERVALESAIVAAGKNAAAFLITTTGETKPPIRLRDLNRPAVVGACNWKPAV